jgi:hypothetical protein
MRVVQKAEGDAQTFQFDKIHDSTVGNEEIHRVVSLPAARLCVEGFNVTVFCYGQSGSGKTHTMMGSNRDPGLLFRTVDALYDMCSQQMDRRFSLRVEACEMCDEETRDLLSPESTNLKIVDHPFKGPCVAGITERVISSAESARTILDEALTRRATSQTTLNARSSRSHVTVRITVESREVRVTS